MRRTFERGTKARLSFPGGPRSYINMTDVWKVPTVWVLRGDGSPVELQGFTKTWRTKYSAVQRSKSFQNAIFSTYIHFSYKPVSQSCAVAKSGKFWRATGESNSAYKQLPTTKASNVWFSPSHNCTLSDWAVFHSVCPPEFSTFTYCAWLWNWLFPYCPGPPEKLSLALVHAGKRMIARLADLLCNLIMTVGGSGL